MDSTRFDAWTRRFHSRRTALASLLGGVIAVLAVSPTDEATAHNPIPACQKVAGRKERLACLRRARRHNRIKHTCKPQPAAVTCANRCGTVRNNCKKPVTCTCPIGKACLANFGCTRTCLNDPPVPCPPGSGCACAVFLAENPSIVACTPMNAAVCAPNSIPCVTSANCPLGSFCAKVAGACGTDLCMPNCPA